MVNPSGTPVRPEGPDRRIARLAAAQQGVFSRAQAVERGATPRIIHGRVATRRWIKLHPGVYRIMGAPTSWRQTLMALCLAWGPEAVASHRAAAALWRLNGFDAQIVELSVARARNRSRVDALIVHRTLDPRDQSTTIDRIPVTTVARTLLDLCGVAPREAVEDALDDALNRRLVALPHLRRLLDRRAQRGRAGISMMRALLEQRDPASAVPQSVLETAVLRAFRQAGLPPPETQHRVIEHGRTVAVVDFAYPDRRLAIEADGYRWHAGRARWQRDLARRNALTALGWRLIHVTWSDLAAGDGRAVHAVARALSGRR